MRILVGTFLLLLLIGKSINTFANDVIFIWSGAITDTSAKITLKVQYTSINLRLKLSTNPTFVNPFYTNFLVPDTSNHPIYTVNISGLNSDTKYYFLVEDSGVVCAGSIGSFSTASNGPISFRFACGSCSSSGQSCSV